MTDPQACDRLHEALDRVIKTQRHADNTDNAQGSRCTSPEVVTIIRSQPIAIGYHRMRRESSSLSRQGGYASTASTLSNHPPLFSNDSSYRGASNFLSPRPGDASASAHSSRRHSFDPSTAAPMMGLAGATRMGRSESRSNGSPKYGSSRSPQLRSTSPAHRLIRRPHNLSGHAPALPRQSSMPMVFGQVPGGQAMEPDSDVDSMFALDLSETQKWPSPQSQTVA